MKKPVKKIPPVSEIVTKSGLLYTVKLTVRLKELQFIVDCGCVASVIDKSVAQDVNAAFAGVLMPRLFTPGGGLVKTVFATILIFDVAYRVQAALFTEEMKVLPPGIEGIIGNDLLSKWKATINLNDHTLTIYL